MKKFTALLLVLAMVFALAACGSSAATSSAAKSSTASSSAASSSKASSASSAAASSSSKASSAAASSSKASGSSSGSKYRVAYFNRDDTDEFLNTLTTMVQKECEADSSIEFKRYDAKSDASTQVTQIEDAVTRGVDFCIISTQDKESMVSKVTELNKKNIPVLCIDISLEHNTCNFIYIGSDNRTLAKAEGKYMMDKLPANGKIIYLRFPVGNQTSTDRDAGIMDAIKDSGRTDYKILTTVEYKATQADAMTHMEDILQVYGNDWDALITHNDKGTYGAISAIEAAGYSTKDKLVCSIDGEDQAMQFIKDGKIDVSMMQNKQGMADQAFKLIKTYQGGGKADKENYYIDGVSITADNVGQYLK